MVLKTSKFCVLNDRLDQCNGQYGESSIVGSKLHQLCRYSALEAPPTSSMATTKLRELSLANQTAAADHSC
jgi:hypothetical protein